MGHGETGVLDGAGIELDEVYGPVAHQVNARILEAVGERLGLAPDRIAVNIADLGNTSAVSIPKALGEAVETGRLEEGDCVVLTAFGAGSTWGTGAVLEAAGEPGV